jgi:hypothetical protein
MKLIYFFFFLIISSSFTCGFDCSYFDDQSDCLALLEANESLIANLIYENSLNPDFDFIEDYNSQISVIDVSQGVVKQDSGRIRNAWFTLLTIHPSILYDNELYIDSSFKVRTAFDYDVSVPSTYYSNERRRVGRTCEIRYNLHSTNEEYSLYINNNLVSNNPDQSIFINSDALINPKLSIQAVIRNKIYVWRIRYSRWRCEYDRNSYSTSTINLEDSIQIKKYIAPEDPDFIFIYNHSNTHFGNLTEYNGNMRLSFENSEYITNKYEFVGEFTNHPYYFLQLKAVNSSSISHQNIYYYNDLLAVANKNNCLIEYSDFFNSYSKDCIEDYSELELEPFELKEYSANWTLILYLTIFIAVNYGIYVLFRKYFVMLF